MNPTIPLLIPLISLFIPIIAIVMGIGIGMFALILNYKRRKEMFVLYHQERMAAIDKGIELPPLPDGFFTDGGKLSRSPHRRLLAGLVLFFIGIILFVALYYRNGLEEALFALIPAGIGLAYLIYYFTVGRKEALIVEHNIVAKATSEV